MGIKCFLTTHITSDAIPELFESICKTFTLSKNPAHTFITSPSDYKDIEALFMIVK